MLYSDAGTYVHRAVAVEQEQILKNATETKKKSAARVADVEDKLKNSKAVRERELKQAQKEVDDAKKRYDQSITKTKEKEQVECLFCACECDLASAVFYLMPLPAISRQCHSVFGLSVRVHLCVTKVCHLTIRLWEFCQIYYLAVFADKGELTRRSKVKVTARPRGQLSTFRDIFSPQTYTR